MAKFFFSFLIVASVALNSAVLLQAEAQSESVALKEKDLDPVQNSQTVGESSIDEDRGDREKRLGVLKKIGFKAGLLDLVFGKIDSLIDYKTRLVNQWDQQNAYKNHKYFGITPSHHKPPYTQLIGSLVNAKTNLLGTAVSSLIASKLSQASGSLAYGSGSHDSSSYGPTGSSSYGPPESSSYGHTSSSYGSSGSGDGISSLIGSVVSSFIQSKLSQASGSLGYGTHGSGTSSYGHSSSSYGSSSSSSGDGVSSLIGSVISSLIQSKLSQTSGSLGYGTHDSGTSSYGSTSSSGTTSYDSGTGYSDSIAPYVRLSLPSLESSSYETGTDSQSSSSRIIGLTPIY